MARDGPVLLRVDTAALGTRLRLQVAEPALLLTLPGTVEVGTSKPARLVDRASWMVLPAGHRLALRVASPSARIVVLELDPVARARTAAEYAREKMDLALLGHVLSSERHLPRTTWVDELAHRYVFERGICKKHGSVAAVFLETELLKEAYFLTVEREEARERAPLSAQHTDVVARALAHIERSLGDELSLPQLARVAGAGLRTLQRAFRRELGLSPQEYVRARRLDEARTLLRSGRHRVGEVAERVGYDSLPAFSTAYRARFGHPPSADLGGAQ